MPTRRAILAPAVPALLLGTALLSGSPGAGHANQAGRPADRGAVIATTHRGKIRGVVQDGIRVFKGVPYGAPTDGNNRFRAPRPVPAWTGVRDALGFGPNCPQPASVPSSLTASWTRETAMAEDCLTLNIWTPGLRDQRKRPVMVWFHGDGFATSSGSLSVQDGHRLARRGDVVVVTLNHRLNVFGHLYLAQLGGAEFAESGNAGLLDLIAALRWINAAIVEFGGDPANVTIFGQGGGQGGGGAKVSVLMAMPQARGLFHRAIIQSGSHLDALSPEEATRAAAAMLAELDLKPQDTARIRTLTADRIMAAMAKVMARPGPRANFGPVLDGIALTRQPWSPDAPPVSAQVPLLVGTTATETTALIGGTDPAVFGLTDADLPARLRSWLPEREIERVVAGYRRLMPNASASDLFFAITTARLVRQPAWAQAERKAAQGMGAGTASTTPAGMAPGPPAGTAQGGAPVWLYELDWGTPVDGGKWRSPHGLDLPFVFDTVARSESMFGGARDAQALADHMSSAWIAFARTGNPNGPREPAWPAFNPRGRATMVFDVKPRVVNDHRGAERTLLANLPLVRAAR